MKHKLHVEYPDIKLTINGKEIILPKNIKIETSTITGVPNKLMQPIDNFLWQVTGAIAQTQIKVNSTPIAIKIENNIKVNPLYKNMEAVYKELIDTPKFGSVVHKLLVKRKCSCWISPNETAILNAANCLTESHFLNVRGLQILNGLREKGPTHYMSKLSVLRTLLAITCEEKVKIGCISDYLLHKELAVTDSICNGWQELELTQTGRKLLESDIIKLLPQLHSDYLVKAAINLLPAEALPKYLSHENERYRQAAAKRLDELKEVSN